VVGKEAPLVVHLTDFNPFQPASSDMLTTRRPAFRCCRRDGSLR
jgi:hypothetical protein